MTNKTPEQIAFQYEQDFKEEVSKANEDESQWMVPRDEPYYHFLAGWRACQEKMSVVPATEPVSMSDAEAHLHYTLSSIRASQAKK